MKVFRCGSLIATAALITAIVLGSGCAAPSVETTTPPPASEPNQAPLISSITAEPAEITYGDSSALICTATDPEYDPIKYSWSASEGTITGTGKEVTWTAPNKDGDFNISITLTDSRGGKTTGNIVVNVSAPIKMVAINPVAAETGTVAQTNATDYSKTWAGDDAKNVGYRAFWGFNISSLAGKDIQSADLKFTTAKVTGDPFGYHPSGLGGLLLWKTTHGSTLPEFGYVGSKLISTGYMLDPPIVIDVTTEIKLLTSHKVGRFQVEALFDRVSNGDNAAEGIEWSSAVLEVTYSVK